MGRFSLAPNHEIQKPKQNKQKVSLEDIKLCIGLLANIKCGKRSNKFPVGCGGSHL